MKLTYLDNINETHYLPRLSYLWYLNNNLRSSLSYSEHTELIAQQSTVEALSSHIYDRWLSTTSLQKRPIAKHLTFILAYQSDSKNIYQLKVYQKDIKDNYLGSYEDPDINNTFHPNFQDVIYNAIQFSTLTKFNTILSTQLTYTYFQDDFHHDNEEFGNYIYSRHNLKTMTVMDYSNWRFTLSSKNIFNKEIKYDIENLFTLAEDRKDYMIIDFSALHLFQFDDITFEVGAVFKNILDQSNRSTLITPESPLNTPKPQTYVSFVEIFQRFTYLLHLKASF